MCSRPTCAPERARLIELWPFLTDIERTLIRGVEVEGLTVDRAATRAGTSNARTTLMQVRRKLDRVDAADLGALERCPQTPGMRGFITYFGAKGRVTPSLPAPRFDHIVEPFAGSAGYSVRWCARRVTLLDVREVVCGVWRYLVGASASEIRALPLLRPGQSTHELRVPEEARDLIGFWCGPNSARPAHRLTPYAARGGSQGWSPEVRERIASQVDSIRHWRVICGDYTQAPDVAATWMIDPPFEEANYYGTPALRYGALAEWCRSRRGQVIVTEQAGASWLPFEPVPGHSRTVAWVRQAEQAEPPARLEVDMPSLVIEGTATQVALAGLLRRERQDPTVACYGADWSWTNQRVRQSLLQRRLVRPVGERVVLTAAGRRAAEAVPPCA